MAVDDSPHSHSAWLWVVENVLRDQDEIILLHGVTTNVRSHRRCTDANFIGCFFLLVNDSFLIMKLYWYFY